MSPLESEMDYNISCVLKFAAIGVGVDFINGLFAKAESKVLFSGLGADEYFCGYSRYRVAFIRNGYEEMFSEMIFDQNRLWMRNLGRDDRIFSSEKKESRTPFLYKKLVEFSKSVEPNLLSKFEKNDKNENVWMDKILLRKLAKFVGLDVCSTLKKKAIQFGTGLAKENNINRYGSNRKAKGHFKIIE